MNVLGEKCPNLESFNVNILRISSLGLWSGAKKVGSDWICMLCGKI